jgi:hypothetical protein
MILEERAMGYIVRNVSKGYAYLLKREVAPNGTLDLEEVFEGFCKPKRSKRAEEPKYYEYTKDQFPKFLERVKKEYAVDQGVWRLELPNNGESNNAAPIPNAAAAKKTQKRSTAITSRAASRKTSSDVTPKEMAWLTYDDASKKIINNCSEVRKLKMAHKLARNLAGQERVRDILANRIAELSVDGVV